MGGVLGPSPHSCDLRDETEHRLHGCLGHAHDEDLTGHLQQLLQLLLAINLDEFCPNLHHLCSKDEGLKPLVFNHERAGLQVGITCTLLRNFTFEMQPLADQDEKRNVSFFSDEAVHAQ